MLANADRDTGDADADDMRDAGANATGRPEVLSRVDGAEKICEASGKGGGGKSVLLLLEEDREVDGGDTGGDSALKSGIPFTSKPGGIPVPSKDS